MMIRSTLFAAAALTVSACSSGGSSASTETPGDNLTAGAGAVTYSFDASSGAWPSGTTFAFSDYPISEDAEAQSAARLAKQEELAQRLQNKLGRPALVSEWAQHNPELDYEVNALGYWLNARFEKAVSSDATPALVFSQINHSDNVDTNILFTLDASSGLTKNTRYSATATLALRTNAATGCLGVGGSPDGVTYSLAFSRTPLTRGVERFGEWRLTNRSGGGTLDSNTAMDPEKLAGTALELGSIGAPNAIDCNGWNEFEDVTHTATGDFETDASGVLHGALRTHSGFEGMSVWALRSFTVTLERR